MADYQYKSRFTRNEIDERLERAGNVSNPNLLDNWYFGNPVNQRGQTEYTGANAYTIDRWMVRGASEGSYLKVSFEYGTVLTYANSAGSSNTVAFIQSLDAFKDLLGKTVTLSVLVEENSMSGGFQLGGWFAQNAFAQSATAMGRSQYFSGAGLFSFTAKIPETTEYDYFNVGISVNPASNIGGRIKLIAAKLELGSQQTLAHQDSNGNWVLNEIPNYGEQLRRCQRYYQLYSAAEQRPAKAVDCRPTMRVDPSQSTIVVNSTTYYYNTADL